MNIRLICVGKLKEGYMRDACRDYEKRLGHYCGLEIIELPDEKAPESLSGKQRLQLLRREAVRIEAALRPGECIAMDIAGRQYDSPGFAQMLDRLESSGGGNANFIIGGSLGLCPQLLEGCRRVSMSQLTFPHNMARLLLLEQLYRSMKINRGEVYHK